MLRKVGVRGTEVGQEPPGFWPVWKELFAEIKETGEMRQVEGFS